MKSTKRHMDRQLRKDGTADAAQVYALLRDSLKITRDSLPEAHGEFSLVAPRAYVAAADGPLPCQEDIREVLKQALAILKKARSKDPAMWFLVLALSRHLELNVPLTQAFGYAKFGKGAPRGSDIRGQLIACEVFKEFVINGRSASAAGGIAEEKFGIHKTQALAAFEKHYPHALRTFKVERAKEGRKPLWTREEKRRLIACHRKQKSRSSG